MFFRTHLVMLLFFWLIFFKLISNPFLFLIIAIFATMLPDIDNRFSKMGKHFKIFNFFMKHRGITHSLVFLFLISIPIFLFAREFLLAFVFGYSLHLFLDGITIKGVSLFYPARTAIRGFIKTGGLFENILLVFFFFADLFLIFIQFSNIL